MLQRFWYRLRILIWFLSYFYLWFQLVTLLRNDVIGKPIKINSSYRCIEHNKKIKGSVNSQHILGKAADIKVKGYSTKNLASLIEELIYGGHILQGGLGVYNTFVHYDIRKTKARWVILN